MAFQKRKVKSKVGLKLQKEAPDLFERLDHFKLFICYLAILFQVVFGPFHGELPLPDKMVDDLKILNVYRAKKPVAFLIFFRLDDVEFFFPEPQ